ncbi:MAG: hypothetical protein ACO390_16365 [bacterium]
MISAIFALNLGGRKASGELLAKCLLKAWFEPNGMEGEVEQDVPPDVPPLEHYSLMFACVRRRWHP